MTMAIRPTSRKALRFLTGLLLALCAIAVAQSTNSPSRKPDEHYEFRKEHDPNGIGKFFMDREIAYVMGHQAADWLERNEREQEERPERLLRALKIKAGSVVADIGAGTGYYTRRLAKLVGPAGIVYAVDIQPEMLELLTNKMAELKIGNVKPILGTNTTPNLPKASVDLILLVDVYHEFDLPYEMALSMTAALKAGGRLVFVEFRREDPNVPIKLVHKMSEAQVRKEMSLQKLRWHETIETLPWQHIIIFQKE